MSASRYTALILDLGDVLFSWSSHTTSAIPPSILGAILSTPTWFDYERGRISEMTCFERIAATFSEDPVEVSAAITNARQSIQINEEMLALLRDLRDKSRGRLRIFALSNISVPDYQFIKTLPFDWSIFDDVFPSGIIGERKPDLAAYQYVVTATGIDPLTTVFVDDRPENVESARSLGMHGIVFTHQEDVLRALRSAFPYDPLKSGIAFLRTNAKALRSVTDGGISFMENFTQLLILELTQDETLVQLHPAMFTWNFFQGNPLFTETFPDDVDTTSLALTIMPKDPSDISAVMDEIAKLKNSDGILQTYFDPERQRIDPVVNVNALCLFYKYGRGHELEDSLTWIRNILQQNQHLEGSRYYQSPDCFLYFVGRLLLHSNDPYLHDVLRPALVRRVRERIGVKGDAMELSMRLLVCNELGIYNKVDMEALYLLQCDDGGWKLGWLYRFGSTGVRAGNRGLTTALAIQAIERGSAQCALREQPSQLYPTKSIIKNMFLSRGGFNYLMSCSG
ncbi:HAD-like protein [Wolfiporia cocos MD-104 SS10]|uniref:HAD-like protein n=1 Tax=Wolfiporia cocos (strain MD-104) TaxID=742152 RepID=A0A2H3K0K7_WOLCO|nr:HAD-like protein [Wolfiporia cocos MD-104 SS10]